MVNATPKYGATDGLWDLPAKGGAGASPRAPSCMDLQPWFPGLELIEWLGAGGMGAVYKARQPRLDRFVAVKILSCPTERNADFALRFEREAKVMARLNHPHIVTIHDFGEIDRSAAGLETLFYFLMEYVDGSDLNRLIATGDLTCEQAMGFVEQVCEALQYAHDEGITHRDIKPANLLVDRKGHLKIADFGLAKLLRGDETLAMGLTMTGTAMGTPHYMAPEQWEAPGTVDCRADIYSLGVVFYELLTKERPAGVFDPPSRKCPMDPRIDAIVFKAMEREPSRRFQQATEVSEALARVVGRRGGKSERRWIFRWAALVAVVLLAGFGAWERKGNRGGEGVAGPPRIVGLAEVGTSVPSTTPAANLASATINRPFVNGLGMKFVPVPGTDVLFCIHETRWRDYEEFAQENRDIATNWHNQTHDGFPIKDHPEDHPVVHVSWDDAQAFCKWLSENEGRTYRLPTDREWSVAVGLGALEKWDGATTPEMLHGKISGYFPWGKAWPPPPGSGNYSDASRQAKAPRADAEYIEGGYDDGYPTTAPVMRFAANEFGIFDLGGNVWEWVEDWFNASYGQRVLRGGSFIHDERVYLLSSRRHRLVPTHRWIDYGFRIVLETGGKISASTRPPPAPPAAAAPKTLDPALATKDAPFENSLGMKFVPVPGTKVLFCIHETRFSDYEEYAKNAMETVNGGWKSQSNEGVEITRDGKDDPVTRMSWNDAEKFCAWLSEKEGKAYRLPTDQEWSLAVGIGGEEDWKENTTPATVFKPQDAFPWGEGWPPPPGTGNYSDASRQAKTSHDDAKYVEGGYDDGFPTTAPVMGFEANKHGLYDLGGNVWEWCGDWYSVEQKERVLRGASWNDSGRGFLLSAFRHRLTPDTRSHLNGFRVVIELP